MKERKPKPEPNKTSKKKSSGKQTNKFITFSVISSIIMLVCAIVVIQLSARGYVSSSFYYASRFIYCCVGGWFAGSLFIAFGMGSKSASSKRAEEDSEDEEEDEEEVEQKVQRKPQRQKPERKQKERPRKERPQKKTVVEEEDEEEEEEEVKPKHKPKQVRKNLIRCSEQVSSVQEEDEDDEDDDGFGSGMEDYGDLFEDLYDTSASQKPVINLHATQVEVPQEELSATQDIDPEKKEELFIEVVPPPINEPITQEVEDVVSLVKEEEPVFEFNVEKVTVSEPETEEPIADEPVEEEVIEEQTTEGCIVEEEPAIEPIVREQEEPIVEETPEPEPNQIEEEPVKIDLPCWSGLPVIEWNALDELAADLDIGIGSTVLKCTGITVGNTIYCKSSGCRGAFVKSGTQIVCSYGIEFTKLNMKPELYPLTRIQEVSTNIIVPDSDELLSLITPVCAIVTIDGDRDVSFDDLSIGLNIRP